MVSYGDDPTTMTPSQTVRFFLCGLGPFSHPHSDFRNKLGSLHQSYTPNQERELYIKVSAFTFYRGLTRTARIVHLTSATDTRRTHTIISSGKLALVSHRLASVTYCLPSLRFHFEIEPEDGWIHVIHTSPAPPSRHTLCFNLIYGFAILVRYPFLQLSSTS